MQRVGRDVCTALADYEIPALETAVCQRAVFAERAAAGSTVLEVAPRSPAASEIRQLALENESSGTMDDLSSSCPIDLNITKRISLFGYRS